MADREPIWRIFIDVGGTFTDCVARSPSGEVHTAKVLSTATVKGRIGSGSTERELVDPGLAGDADDFFRGFEVRLLGAGGRVLEARGVVAFDGRRGAVAPGTPFGSVGNAVAFELVSPEEAPLLAIRRILRLRLDEDIGRADVRLGTTRGTNALLERKGARTGLVTNRGFGDALRIGYQDRPRIFDLEIRRPSPLFERVVEVAGRLGPSGEVLEPLDLADARGKLEDLRAAGIESIAIVLLHSARNAEHEEALETLAREVGLRHVVRSSRASSVPKLVPRGDTALADAYLNPVIESYVESIRSRAPGARLKLLTSAGGLSSPEAFSGSDSILSGPAGGVVGAARAAERAGFARAIGFDMGGTSTDASRFDGELETEFAAEKAGVRIAAPVLAIETVAQGGGSICRFDGERLTVGPESAGAWPGPACYGNGGPLTVTDLDLYLGRTPADRFPFPLDRDAVERRLLELCQALGSAGLSMDPVEVASGCLAIAESRMAAAVRRISVARGFDVREYVLVAFGGAGGQHACAVARELGMRTVLVPALAGILSAEGAGLAGVRTFAERPLLRPLSESSRSELAVVFDELERQAVQAARSDGVQESALEPPRRMLELRYRGQEATLRIDARGADWRGLFEEAHHARYGFAHRGRPVEAVTARVECVTRAGREPETTLRPDAVRPPRTARAVFDGIEHETPVLDAAGVEPGGVLEGPAILAAPFHTAVVEPGWTAHKTEHGDWILERRDRNGPAAEAPGGEAAGSDPVELEIFHQHFASIAEEMGIVLERSALSTNVRERLDFSCAVFDRDGGLVANAPHIPVHLGAMGDCVKHVARDVPDLGPGDIVVTNDPFHGGSHLPDVTVVTPVHDDDGELLFYTASRAHHAEIGGKRPGSMPPDSRSLAEEGVLLRNLRVFHRGRPCFEALERALASGPFPSRSPHENIRDIEAQIAANRAGAALLARLIARRGKDRVLRYMGHIQDAARRLTEARLERLPQGTSSFADALDDGARIVVTITVERGRARVDFSGTDGVLESNLNATPAIVSSAVLYAFRSLIEEDIPLNAGVLAPIDIVLPRCLLNPPPGNDAASSPAVSGGNVETSQRVVDVVFGALEAVAASQGTMNNLLFGNDRFGYYETIAGGAGAGPGFHGAGAVHTHMTNTRMTDAEVLERRYPVRLHRFEIRRGSGGSGRHRGGDGVVRELEFLEEVEVTVLSQRRTRRPYGLRGGGPGAAGRNSLRRRGATDWEDLGPIATFRAAPGDTIRIETPGGGGWGR